MKLAALLVTLSLAIPQIATAEKYSFDVDAKLVNVTFESRMDIEDILGTTHSASGFVNLADGDKGTFEVRVPVASLRTGIDLCDEHLRSEALARRRQAQGHRVRGKPDRQKAWRHV